MRDTTIWVASAATMNKRLTPEQRKIVEDCARQALNWGNEYLAKTEGEIIERIRSKGVQVSELTDEEKSVFREQCKGIYEDYKDTVGENVIKLFTQGYLED